MLRVDLGGLVHERHAIAAVRRRTDAAGVLPAARCPCAKSSPADSWMTGEATAELGRHDLLAEHVGEGAERRHRGGQPDHRLLDEPHLESWEPGC